MCIRDRPYEEAFAVTAGRGVRHAGAGRGAAPCHVPGGALEAPRRFSGVVISGSDVFQTHGCRWSWDHGRVTPAPTHRVSARLSAIAPSATLAVDAKAKALKAAGRPVIGFGAGEPDFPTPDYIVEAAVAAAKDPANHKYSPAKGLPVLREAIAAKTLRDSGYEVAPDDILVTNGGKQAVFQAFAALVDPGDEVLLPAPFWTTYPEALSLIHI